MKKYWHNYVTPVSVYGIFKITTDAKRCTPGAIRF